MLPNHVICQDSSIENLEGTSGGDVPANKANEAGNIEARGHVLIHWKDWLEAWHDVGENGEKFVKFGIAVGPPAGV